jgi:hypothetical protein
MCDVLRFAQDDRREGYFSPATFSTKVVDLLVRL